MNNIRDLIKQLKNTELVDMINRCQLCGIWTDSELVDEVSPPDTARALSRYVYACLACRQYINTGVFVWCDNCSTVNITKDELERITNNEHRNRLRKSIGSEADGYITRLYMTDYIKPMRVVTHDKSTSQYGFLTRNVCHECIEDVCARNHKHGFFLDCLKWVYPQKRMVYENKDGVMYFHHDFGAVRADSQFLDRDMRVIARSFSTSGVPRIYFVEVSSGLRSLWTAVTQRLSETAPQCIPIKTARVMNPRSTRKFARDHWNEEVIRQYMRWAT